MNKSAKNSLKLSLIIPAYNEEMNILSTIRKLVAPLRQEKIPFELVVVDDCCSDGTVELVIEEQKNTPEIVLIRRIPPRGFGRAIREGLGQCTGQVIIPLMADLSDDPQNVIKYYRKIEEGYDCVFGSRFKKGSKVKHYPWLKLLINRLANHFLQVIFATRFNDLTNSFKAYRDYVIQDIVPLHACHFNITIEMSLSALIREYKIASVPVSWNGRTWGQSKLKLGEMGRRYLATMLKIWFEKIFILDDLLEEKENRVKESKDPLFHLWVSKSRANLN